MSVFDTQKLSPGAGTQTIVVGGGMAGLLAARVLTDHFDRVTLIERNRFPEGAQSRKEAPQGGHAHTLLARGQEIIAQLFPGIIESLREQDGVVLSMNWALLEAEIRRRVLSLKPLAVIEGCVVERLDASDDCARVTGVVVRRRVKINEFLDTEASAIIPADLVVDATGRDSQSPRWLKALGYRRQYEKMERWPEGYVAVGGAMRNFNSGYGQGMAVSALGAITLDACLRELWGGDLSGLPQRYFRKVAKAIDAPWALNDSGPFAVTRPLSIRQ
jgi:ribulose 1,5-bisphosphate synthetase/thiazole synthase